MKKLLSVLLSAALIGGLCAGCSKAPKEEGGDSGIEVSGEESEKSKTTLTFVQHMSGVITDELQAVLDEFEAETLRGQAACRQKDAAALEKTAAELQSLWEKREGFLSFYVHHDDLDRLEMGLVSLSAHIENESFENAFSALEQLRFQASHIYQRELPGWNNLF